VIVLDANINYMTKFKQIVGRGTRINEEFNKLYFTIIDFRNATDNFADPDFDGDPLRVKPTTEETDLSTIIEDEFTDESTLIDEISGEEIEMVSPVVREPSSKNEYAKLPKQYINGVNVAVLVSRELYFDNNGKPITLSLKDYTKNIITQKFASLDDFLIKWNQTEKKEAIIKELQEQGVMVEVLYDAVDKKVDLFDLICHIAYDQPPLTRKERANNVKKRNYFTKYGEQARKVLETLLDKYADEGVENIESIEVLRVKPFDEYGSPIEIINHFGSKINYFQAVKELENELYRKA
jgi:type I restriction enzyme R subunit